MAPATELTITAARADELLRFLPLFEAPERSFVERWGGGEETAGGATTMPFPIYPKEVEEFFRLAGQPWWCDHAYTSKDAGEMLSDDARVEGASMEQLKTMLTHCVRGERFCDGHWGAVLASGRVSALLRRLSMLRASLPGGDLDPEAPAAGE